MSSVDESAPTSKKYTRGTHRELTPDQTLARIEPHLLEFGVTRCADVTWLDRIGIPVYTGIRPITHSVEVSAGKGATQVAAKVSCLMEAIEVAHWDTPLRSFRRASFAELAKEGSHVIPPEGLPDYMGSGWYDEDRVVEWVEGEDLFSGAHLWLPAGAVYIREHPLLFDAYSNGLASGNSVVEASLHAVYEILERHLISQAIVPGGEMDVIDLSTVQDDYVRELLNQMDAGGIKLVLLSPAGRAPLSVFMAVTLEANPLAAATRAVYGFGAHLSRSVAASRAITEAAQSRGTLIHGARDDVPAYSYQGEEIRVAVSDLISGAEPNIDWDAFPDRANPTLEEDYEIALQCLKDLGLTRAYRADLTRYPGIHVVRVVVEGARVTRELF
jgi:ribosomal protein S12 methylthiotransferase accessory factor